MHAGSFGVILVILECRITVCYKMFCQIRKRVLDCRALHVLQNVLSPKRFAFCASLLHQLKLRLWGNASLPFPNFFHCQMKNQHWLQRRNEIYCNVFFITNYKTLQCLTLNQIDLKIPEIRNTKTKMTTIFRRTSEKYFITKSTC